MTIRRKIWTAARGAGGTLLLLPSLFLGVSTLGRSNGTVEFRITDAQDRVVPCRVHILDAAAKPVRIAEYPYWNDHFVFSGSGRVSLPPGTYSYEIERGPEFEQARGNFVVAAEGVVELRVVLRRIANLAEEGWWSGDLHVHRPMEQLPLHLEAEDLNVAPVITWWNRTNLWNERQPPAETLLAPQSGRYYDLMAGEDEREGGALLFFHLKRPMPIADADREYPSPMRFIEEARKDKAVWIDVEKPFWWDVPVWLASGQVDSIGLANNHMSRSRMYESEAWGKPRDSQRLPPPRGNGLWSQEIYYHILNAGLRLPPSAGSASGVLPNPVGYNRVYVHAGQRPTYEQWWSGLRAGRSFVTNGPLLTCRATGQLPGHSFKSPEPLTVHLAIFLRGRDRIDNVEIVRNGNVEGQVPVNASSGTWPDLPLRFESSGWFLVRAIADNERTFRFASTAPFYVEIGSGPPRISRHSAQFFLDWVRERIARVKIDDANRRDEVLTYHRRAEQFWLDRVQKANVD